MKIEKLREFNVDGTVVVLECVTGVDHPQDEKEHFCVNFSHGDSSVTLHFHNARLALEAFNACIKHDNWGQVA